MSRVSSFPSRPPSRPPSELLCDLHVYKVPWDLWREPLNNILNQSVTDTISLGIIRVHPEVPLIDLRQEIQRQLEDAAPSSYVFLRSVGRSLTRLKKKQEYQLKARDFLSPKYYAPELYVLEATQEMQDAFAASERSSQQSRNSHGSPGGRTYRNGYRSDRDRNGYPGHQLSRSQQRHEPARQPQYSPLPRINPSSPTPHSREGSPAPFLFDSQGFGHSGSTHHHQYPSSSSWGFPPQDSADTNPNPQQSHTAQTQHREEGVRRGEEGYPSHSSKESPQTLAGREDRAWRQAEGQASNAYRARAAHSDRLPPAFDGGGSSPRQSARKGEGQASRATANGFQDERDAALTYPAKNGDSAVAGFTPEDQYKNRDKENYYDALNSKTRDLQNRLNRDQLHGDDDDDDHRRRLKELEDRALMDSERWAKDQEERRRRAEEERRREEEEERKRREEEEERRRRQKEQEEKEEEEERRRKREEEEEEEEERRKREEEARRREEELNRFPSPPPLHLSSSDLQRDTESARQRRREEKQRLLNEIEDARETRQITEKEREELVKKAKNLQMKTQNRRNQARDIWKKRYFEEKKKTPPLEEQSSRLKEELEALHRRLMAVLEGPKEKNLKLGDNRPSQKNNYVIQCTRLQHDIDDLKRRIENAKMKLTTEMKLRNQAEAELRSLRAELIQKKIHLSLARSHQMEVLSSSSMQGLPSEATPVPDIPAGKRDREEEPHSLTA